MNSSAISEFKEEMCHIPVHIGIELPDSSSYYRYETIISVVVPVNVTKRCACKFRHIDSSLPGSREAENHLFEEVHKWATSFMSDKPENSANWSWDII